VRQWRYEFVTINGDDLRVTQAYLDNTNLANPEQFMSTVSPSKGMSGGRARYTADRISENNVVGQAATYVKCTVNILRCQFKFSVLLFFYLSTEVPQEWRGEEVLFVWKTILNEIYGNIF
jgi:hypothetical protein